MPQFRDYHRTVVGYHGTRLETARKIVQLDEPFTPSENDYDWLGPGVYFWEYAPKRAWEWARNQFKTDKIAVLGAMIRLGNCFDLLDPDNLETLASHHDQIEKDLEGTDEALPKNYQANKYRDCAVFRSLFLEFEDRKEPIDTCRAVFVPSESAKKDRLWSHSGLFRGAHIQLCVRSIENILGVWMVR